ncbi:alpha-1,3-galactosidase-related protein [Persicobacter diffluens]|uniref:Alpha-1,3-galactosidase A n=1 Tax=Persicobacter diffluens TaxID=981 RepID=A0AAN4W4T5_9BACT|nr:alpha-1,3-galactosidase A [Persicobacter diffluens]
MSTMSFSVFFRRITLFLFSIFFTHSISATHIRLSSDHDRTPEVLSIVQSLPKSGGEITFEKGIYHFYPDRAFEKFCFISNHSDEFTRTAFPLLDFKNLTIDGKGSTFIFHGVMIPFLLENSENIEIKNVSIDWEIPFHSQGKIVAHHTEENAFDMEISKEYPYEIRNGELIFVKDYLEHNMHEGILFDPERKAIAYNTRRYTPLALEGKVKSQFGVKDIPYEYETDPRTALHWFRGKEHRMHVEEIKPGLVRVFNSKKALPPIGMMYACKGDFTNNRIAPAFRLNQCKDITIKDINIYHAGGMGFIADNSENLTIDGLVIEAHQGRMVSTTADATHFVGCKGKITIKNSAFSHMLDDGVNIHGAYQRIVEILDEHTIGVRMGHLQQMGYEIAQKGEKIGLVNLEESFFPYQELTVKKLEPVNKRYHKITFEEALPKSVAIGQLIENTDKTPEVEIYNCRFTNNRARGVIVSSPRKVRVHNNYFSTDMSAMFFVVANKYWYESGSATDFEIYDNTFEDCVYGGSNHGVIRFHTNDPSPLYAFLNVKIYNNEFIHFDNRILEITNAENLLFEGNSIQTSNTFPKLFPKQPVITIQRSKNLTFKRNTYLGTAKEMIRADEVSTYSSDFKSPVSQ